MLYDYMFSPRLCQRNSGSRPRFFGGRGERARAGGKERPAGTGARSGEDEVVEIAHADEYAEVEEVDRREEGEVAKGLAGFAAAEFAEGYEAGEGGDGGAEPADIDGYEQVAVVGGEAGEEDCRGDIAYDLAGGGGYEQRRESHQRAEGAPDGGDAREVSREHEEGAECEEQRVVHPEQRSWFQDEQGERDRDERDIKWEDAEDDEHGQREQHEVDGDAPRGRRGDFRGLEFDGDGLHEEAGHRDEHEGGGERQRHDREELPCRDGVIGIEIEVLGIAEGGEHTAEVGGDILHHEDEGGVLASAAGGQRVVAERQEGDERHVVRHDHRTEVSDEHQRERHPAHIAEGGNDLARHPFEKPALFEGADHREGAEQAGEGVEVEIIRVAGVRGHENAGHSRRDHRDDEHDMALREPDDRVHTLGERPVMSACQHSHTERIFSTFHGKKQANATSCAKIFCARSRVRRGAGRVRALSCVIWCGVR